MQNQITLVVAIIGAITGVVGTGLAIWSLYRQVDQDRVKLRVGAMWGLAGHSPDSPFLTISVTNLSKFPVTLREAGLLIDSDKRRAIHPDAQTGDGRRLPIRMEPRTSLSLYFPPGFLKDPRFATARCAYASTDCGETIEAAADVIPKMVAEAQGT